MFDKIINNKNIIYKNWKLNENKVKGGLKPDDIMFLLWFKEVISNHITQKELDENATTFWGLKSKRFLYNLINGKVKGKPIKKIPLEKGEILIMKYGDILLFRNYNKMLENRKINKELLTDIEKIRLNNFEIKVKGDIITYFSSDEITLAKLLLNYKFKYLKHNIQ